MNGRGGWHVNLHYPWWMRVPNQQSQEPKDLLRQLELALMARADIRLTGTASAQRPAAFAGAASRTLNFHTVWSGPRNLHYKEAYLPGFFTFDHAGYSGWSANAGMVLDIDDYTPAEAETYFRDVLWSRYLAPGISKFPQPVQRQDIPPNGIFVALQVPRDSVLRLAHFPTETMLAECLRRAPAEPVVIKLHPRTGDRAFAEKIRALHDPAGNVHVLDEPVAALIDASRVTVCINSGVGIEAQLRGAAVITCGRSDYGTLTDIVATPGELGAALQSAVPPDPDLMRRHATWLFRDVFVDMRAAGWQDKVICRLRRA